MGGVVAEHPATALARRMTIARETARRLMKLRLGHSTPSSLLTRGADAGRECTYRAQACQKSDPCRDVTRALHRGAGLIESEAVGPAIRERAHERARGGNPRRARRRSC